MISAPSGGPQNAFFILVQIPYHSLWNNNMKSNYRIGSSENFQCSLHITHLVRLCVCVYFACSFTFCSNDVEISCSLHRDVGF